MPYFKATIEVLVEVDDEASAYDCIAEVMRPLCKTFDPKSNIIDWHYLTTVDDAFAGVPHAHTGEGFEFVEALRALRGPNNRKR